MAMSFFLRIIPVILIIGLHNGVDIDESIPYIVYNTMPGKNGSMGCAAQDAGDVTKLVQIDLAFVLEQQSSIESRR